MSAGGMFSSMRAGRSERSGILYQTGEGVRKVDPGAVVDKIQSANSVGGPEAHPLPELELPGFGEPYDDCGTEIPRFCASCGNVTEVGRTCRRSRCPRCGESWARETAKSVGSKLEAVRRYFAAAEDGTDHYKFHHLALSPPDGFRTFTENALDRTFDLLKEVLGELGVETGVLFYHPYRGEDGDDRGFWKDLLFNGDDFEDVREELEHAPHFHAVVVAKYVPGGKLTKHLERKTGWVVERITKSDSNVSIFGKYDLARVVSYCLSHTGLYETEKGKRAGYRYFGRVANMVPTEAIESEIDAAVRSVAPKTLGLEYDSLACQEDRRDDAEGYRVAATGAVYGEAPENATALDGACGGGDGFPGAVGDEAADAPEGKCAGRLLAITKAPRFLRDEDWIAAAPYADELREVWGEWRDRFDEDRPPPG